MKRLFIWILCLLAAAACSQLEIKIEDKTPGQTDDPQQPQDPEDPEDPQDPQEPDTPDTLPFPEVFDPGVIPEIHVTVSQAEWDKLLQAFDRNHNTQEHVQANVRYVKGAEETVIEGIGLRLKGNTSRRRPENNGRLTHVHYGLDFHYYTRDKAHKLYGVTQVDLKWFKDDAAYVREIFCYDLFHRAGVWTAIQDVYARLWITVGSRQEAYLGVYGMMEHINDNFVRSRSGFGLGGGNLWKCRYGADLRDPNAYMGADDNRTDFTYELKTNKEQGFPAAKAQLQDFIRKLNSLQGEAFYTWISSVMDVDLLLRTYAVNVAVGMWDDYWNNSNNYYLYFNTVDKTAYQVFFLPYDYDNTLGTSLQCGVQSDAGRHDPYRWGADDRPLMTKVLQKPQWRAAYRQYLQELCTGDMEADAAIRRIQDWQESIRAYVSNDTGEDMTIKDRPAGWGNHGEYRLLERGGNNFFEVKAAAVAAMH